jgi:hypothetical protein
VAACALNAVRPDLKASQSRYTPPNIFTATMNCDHATSAAEMPAEATVAQNIDPEITPSAKARAALRPRCAAMDMMARLLGPGLATPTKYAMYASSRLAEKNVLPDMEREPLRTESVTRWGIAGAVLARRYGDLPAATASMASPISV